jgi:hypothetical protein
MPVRLRGHDGYYSREVEVDGTTFRIQELRDDQVEELARIESQIRRLLEDMGVTGDLLRRAMGEDDPEATAEIARLLSQLDGRQDALAQLRTLQRERRDYIVARGLVGWDIAGVAFQAELSAALPEWVKARLAREILQDTLLPEQTELFLSAPPGR